VNDYRGSTLARDHAAGSGGGPVSGRQRAERPRHPNGKAVLAVLIVVVLVVALAIISTYA
jgi:hypothetical protein